MVFAIIIARLSGGTFIRMACYNIAMAGGDRAAERAAEKDKTFLERQQRAFTEGKPVLFLTCPLCGRGRPLTTWKGKTIFNVKPDYAIVQVRYGMGGRQGGFYLKEDESVFLEDLQASHPDIHDNLKEQVKVLYNMFWGD